MMIPRPKTLSDVFLRDSSGTALPPETVALLSAEYNLEPQRHTAFRKRDGVHNTNAFVLRSRNTPYFLREHVHNADGQSLLFEHSLLYHLSQHKYPVSQPLRTIHGDSFVSRDHKYYVLFTFVSGYIYSQYYLTRAAKKEHIRQSALALAEYHRLVEHFQPKGSKSWRDHRETIGQLDEYYQGLADTSPSDTFARFFVTEYPFLRRTLLEVAHTLANTQDLPMTVVHEDFGPYNIIFNRGRISAVLDFMDAHPDWRAADLAFSLSVFACSRAARYDPEFTKIFLSAYASVFDITPPELDRIPDLLCLKRLNELPFYLRAHHATHPRHPKYEQMFMRFVDEIRWLTNHRNAFVSELKQALPVNRTAVPTSTDGTDSPPRRPLRILIITHVLPFPPDNGSKIPTYHRIRELSNNNRLSLLCVHPDHVDPARLQELEKYCSIHLVKGSLKKPPASILTKGRRFLEGLLYGTPAFLRDEYSAQAQRWIDQRIQEGCFEVIEAADSNAAMYLRDTWRILKIAIFHSVWDASLRRAMACAETVSAKIKTLAFWIVCRRYEKHIGKIADLCVTLTPENRRELLDLEPAARVENCLTNGVDLNYFDYQPCVDGPTGMCFTGRMDYSPNIDAVSYFHREIFSLVRAVRPNSQFFIVGSSPSPAILRLQADPAVRVTGYVPDVRPFLRQSGIAVVPTRTGGGILNKILEALALGVPVVTNTRSIEGLTVRAEEHLLIGDTPEEFANCILRLFDDPLLRATLTRNGRQYVEENHQWSRIIDRYEQALRRQLRLHLTSR